jgi:hypothetical protein
MNHRSINLLDTESLRIVENILNKIPARELLHQCNSISEIDYLCFLKYYFSQVSKAISNYFSGKPLFEETDKRIRELLELELEHWLCFYSLLQWGWDYIIIEAPKQGWEIRATPGELLRVVLINHAELIFVQHQADHLEFSPRKAYKQISLIPKLEGIADRIERGGDITKEDVNLINLFNKLSQTGEEVKPELNNLFIFCIQVFEKYKNKSKIRLKYKDYRRIQGEYDARNMKNWHPNKKTQGHKIINKELHYPP